MYIGAVLCDCWYGYAFVLFPRKTDIRMLCQQKGVVRKVYYISSSSPIPYVWFVVKVIIVLRQFSTLKLIPF